MDHEVREAESRARGSEPEEPAPALESEALLASIVVSSRDAIIAKDLSGIIRAWNPAAERLFGYSAEEAIGQPITMLIPTELRHQETRILDCLRRGEHVEYFETERVAKDGRRLHLSISVSPIRDRRGRIVGASKIARDVEHLRRSQEEARRDRRTLETLVEASPLAISVLDAEGRVHLWNAAAARIFGWSAEEVIGHFAPTVPPERHAEYRANLAKTLAGHQLQGVETVRRRRDGSPIHLALWSSILHDETGAPDRVISIAADIGERKRAEAALSESEERFRTLADNMAQLAWMAHPSGEIFWFNRRFYDYTGLRVATPEQWDWRQVLHPDHVERVVERSREAFSRSEAWEETFPLRGAGGTYSWFLVRLVPIEEGGGEVSRWFGTATDITEHLELEEQLRQADRRKNEFLAVLAHELRNPLAAIRSSIELLRLASPSSSRTAAAISIVDRQAAHLRRLVDDLTDLSRITRGVIQLRRESCDLAAVVEGAIEANDQRLRRAGHRLEVDVGAPVSIEADSMRLGQVVANLLSNAIRYTPAGGRIAIWVDADEQEVVLGVRDSGVGIEEGRLERIFDLFEQGGVEKGAEDGLGIGLTLAREIVELHGGELEARSEGPGRGSEFVVRLPRAPASASPRCEGAVSEPAAGPSRSLRILVVDDNRDAADSLQALLEEMGHDVRAVYYGADALALALEWRPAVVFLDLGLPDVDGLVVAQELCSAAEIRPTLVAVTGWGQTEDRQRTQQAGFDRHLVKPLDLPTLRDVLEEVVRPGSPADDS